MWELELAKRATIYLIWKKKKINQVRATTTLPNRDRNNLQLLVGNQKRNYQQIQDRDSIVRMIQQSEGVSTLSACQAQNVIRISQEWKAMQANHQDQAISPQLKIFGKAVFLSLRIRDSMKLVIRQAPDSMTPERKYSYQLKQILG